MCSKTISDLTFLEDDGKLTASVVVDDTAEAVAVAVVDTAKIFVVAFVNVGEAVAVVFVGAAVAVVVNAVAAVSDGVKEINDFIAVADANVLIVVVIELNTVSTNSSFNNGLFDDM